MTDFDRLDARRRQGTFLVITESGTRYMVELRRSVAGTIRVISNGPNLTTVRELIVSDEENEPVIRVGSSMSLSEYQQPLLTTTDVESIHPIRDGSLDDFARAGVLPAVG